MKVLNSIIPFSAKIGKLFGKASTKEFREKMIEDGNLVIEPNGKIPGAVEIPLQTMIDAGFEFRFFLRSDVGTYADQHDSGIIIASIQNPTMKKESYLIDGISFQFDELTTLEVSALTTTIINNIMNNPFGDRFIYEEFAEKSNNKIDEYNLNMEKQKKAYVAKIDYFEKNPAARQKEIKKALERIQNKTTTLKNSRTLKETNIMEFEKNMWEELGNLFNIAGVTSWEELKENDLFKQEIEKNRGKDAYSFLKEFIEKR